MSEEQINGTTTEPLVEPSGVNQESADQCLNCDTLLTDRYCPHCGQKRVGPRQSIGELLSNFVSSFLSFESKFLVTGKYLLFRPGKLAIEFNAGKRERYYHPARMYVFISFVYFFLLNVLPETNPNKREVVTYSGQNSDNFAMEVFDSSIAGFATLAQYDSIQNTLPAEERDGFWMRKIREREIHLNERYKGKGREFNNAFIDSFRANVPKIFFILLPLFALLLKLLYVRRDFYYSEHLVFSIYYYNFFFLAGSIMLLIDQLPGGDNISWLIGLWILVYLLLALRKMYNQPWWKTILKYGTFFMAFSCLIVVALFVNLALSLLFL